MSAEQVAAHQRRVRGESSAQLPAGRTRSTRGPNKTELAFVTDVLASLGFGDAQFEGLSFRVGDGARYRPDWIAWDAQGRLHCFEVKGAYMREAARVRYLAAADRYRAVFWSLWMKHRSGWDCWHSSAPEDIARQ